MDVIWWGTGGSTSICCQSTVTSCESWCDTMERMHMRTWGRERIGGMSAETYENDMGKDFHEGRMMEYFYKGWQQG